MISSPMPGYCSVPHPRHAGFLCGRFLLGSTRPGWCPLHPDAEQTAPPLPPAPDVPRPAPTPVPRVRLGGRERPDP